MDFIINLFLLGFWIAVAMMVFSVGLYIVFGAIGLVIGLIGFIIEKIRGQ